MFDDLADKAKAVIPGGADDAVIDAVKNAAEKVDVDAMGEKLKDVIPGNKEDGIVDKVTDMLGGDGETNS